MPPTIRKSLDRRTVLRGVAAAAGLGVAGAASRPSSAAAHHGDRPPTRIRRLLQLVDDRRRQRFLLSSVKPPVHVNGTTYPASRRSGPDDASWFVFNDENQSEKGGLTASSGGASMSMDHHITEGLTLSTVNVAQYGAAQLYMQQAPDPSIPLEELTREDIPPRVRLGCSNAGDGSLLFLYDSNGRPRITLRVDGDDVPRIQILDADGGVVAQLPPDAPAAPRAATVSPLLDAPVRRPAP